MKQMPLKNPPVDRAMNVELVLVKAAGGEYREQLLAGICALELAAGQEEFVGIPAEMAPLAVADPSRHLFAILVGAPQPQVVGMGVLHVGGAHAVGWEATETAILLRGFLIDSRHQGLGYGTRATMAAVDLARELSLTLPQPAEGVVLGVNERNPAARTAYLKAGFRDHGRYLEGRSGPQHVMYRPF